MFFSTESSLSQSSARLQQADPPLLPRHLSARFLIRRGGGLHSPEEKKRSVCIKLLQSQRKSLDPILTPTSSSPASRRPRRTESRATRVPRARRCRRRGKGEGGLMMVGKTGGRYQQKSTFLICTILSFYSHFCLFSIFFGHFCPPSDGNRFTMRNLRLKNFFKNILFRGKCCAPQSPEGPPAVGVALAPRRPGRHQAVDHLSILVL